MTSQPEPGALMTELRRMHQNGDHAAAADILERILVNHPTFMPARRWQIDQLLIEGKAEQALVQARETLFHFPEMRAMATTRQATALDRLGQPGAAVKVLMKLHEDGVQDVPATALLGSLLLRGGSLNRAERLFNEIRGNEPAHPGAMRGLIDIAIKRSKAQTGLMLCQDAEKLDCLPASVLQTRRAKCLGLMGKNDEAIAVLAEHVKSGTADAESRMALARLYQSAGDIDAARKTFDDLLAEAPDHVPAVQAQVALLHQLGAYQQAIDVCDKAIERANPVPEVFCLRRAQMLIAAERATDAIAALELAIADSDAPCKLLLELARAHTQAGDLAKAGSVFEASQQYDETYVSATLGRVELAERAGQHEQAVTLLQDAHESGCDPDPELTLALCDTLVRSTQTKDIAELLSKLASKPARLNDAQIEHVLSLAERQTLPDITPKLIGDLTRRETISLGLANWLLKLAHVTADKEVLYDVSEALSAKLAPALRDEFRIDAVGITEGPEAAVAHARRILSGRATPRNAILVGRYLADSGQTILAKRYLRRAARKWPGHRALNALYVHVCGVARDYMAGHAHLDYLTARNPGLDVERERLMLMHAQGATPDVLERATRRQDSGKPGLHQRQYLDLCLACGDLDLALATQRKIRNDPKSTSRVAAHFTTGLHGRMLTDLQVYRTLEARDSGPAKTIENKLAEQYYFPAKQLVDRWADTLWGADSKRDAPIPKRIFQYWDTDTVPKDVAALIEGWKKTPDFEHVLLNRTSAMTLLRSQFGQRAIIAFQRARHVTEESDLLRLCLIFKFGGIYSDADDSAVGDINALARIGSGLVVTREPIGAIANNTLIAPPGNPILRIALQMTIRALIARDADGAWFKSGPGMLTRAAAVYLRDADPDEARRNLTLLDGTLLRKFIQPHIRLPYKKTVKYWNAQDKEVSQKVLASLSEFSKT
ncbi:hypothetical protein GCM10007385_44440 [Tateyamaria omphalii]|uniref:tetratricopeptide repeat protein n=1 Tax=Tateyamaria omphalii TaxID=299262 RepID=UPI0016729806|nr:tetratricopeptide repeat protein [Tateyamaria omphalii]GGX70521.1 hypothetical protein GCM10007385_44440 [Tateyamaria omphalii]